MEDVSRYTNATSYQLHGVLRPQMFDHGVEMSAPHVWRPVALLPRRSWRGSDLFLWIRPIAVFQQVDGPLHQGKALPAHGHRLVGRRCDPATGSRFTKWWFKETTESVYLFWNLPLLWRLSSLKRKKRKITTLENKDKSLGFRFRAQAHFANILILMMTMFPFLYDRFCSLHSSRRECFCCALENADRCTSQRNFQTDAGAATH